MRRSRALANVSRSKYLQLIVYVIERILTRSVKTRFDHRSKATENKFQRSVKMGNVVKFWSRFKAERKNWKEKTRLTLSLPQYSIKDDLFTVLSVVKM
jgi:hypothetical protein